MLKYYCCFNSIKFLLKYHFNVLRFQVLVLLHISRPLRTLSCN